MALDILPASDRMATGAQQRISFMLNWIAPGLSALTLIALIPAAALADEHTPDIDWPSQIAGLDTVTIACANANKEKYAADICADMRKRIRTKLESAGISVADLGDYFVKETARPSNPGATGSPLAITVHVRATDSNGVHAINLRNHISVFHQAAVEQGSDGAGRKGELVMWEGSTTGSGPRKQLAAAIVGASFKKLEVQLDEIVKAWPRP